MRRASRRCRRCRSRWPGRSAVRPSGTHRGHGGLIGLAGSDPDGALERDDEDLPVADLAGSGPPSQRASIVGCTNGSETAISKRTLSATSTLTVASRGRSRPCPAPRRGPGPGSSRSPAPGSVERLQDVVGLLGPDDPDHKLHDSPSLERDTHHLRCLAEAISRLPTENVGAERLRRRRQGGLRRRSPKRRRRARRWSACRGAGWRRRYRRRSAAARRGSPGRRAPRAAVPAAGAP